MALPIGTILQGVGLLAGMQGDQQVPQRKAERMPEWQRKRIQALWDAQLGAANQGLGQQFQGARNQYGGLDTLSRLNQLTGSDSVLGQRAAGNFIGSEGYNKILNQSNQRITDQFNNVTMPGVLGRFSSSGRIGSPSMMRSAEQAQAGLAKGLAQNEAQLLQNERTNQMKAAGQIGNILQNRDRLAANRLANLFKFDPAMIRQSRLQGLNQLAGAFRGKEGYTMGSYNPGKRLGSGLGKLGSLWEDNFEDEEEYTPPRIDPQPLNTPWGGR